MNTSFGLMAFMAAWLAAAPAPAGGSRLVYVKKATREETRAASLAATARTLPRLEQSPWKYVEGPRFKLPPGGAFDTSVDLVTPDGKTRPWRDGAHLRDGVEHVFDKEVQLYRTVVAPADTMATVRFSCDNGIVVNVNGVMNHVTITTHIPPLTDMRVAVPLRKGVNHLLVAAGLRAVPARLLVELSAMPLALETELDHRLDLDFPRSAEHLYYRLETVPLPRDLVMEVGGMAFVPERAGRGARSVLLVATRRGELWSLRGGRWRLFATGLQEPLGLWAERADEVFVTQRTELTRLVDEDGDGVAELYEPVSQGWAVSGGHHEYVFGLVRDRQGAFYQALCALGDPSRARWLGWALRIAPDGKTTPFARGLRCPNGLGVSPDGHLFVVDNQGEYIGSSFIHHLVEGAFYGHPRSLHWDPGFAGRNPTDIPEAELDRLRKRPAIVLPYGPMGQSPTQPLFDTTDGKFGPFAGQMFIGDQTISAVMRVQPEMVDGEMQGAAFPFRSGFQSGNNRLAFAPDGSLWVGQTDRGWGAVGGREYGLQRLVWTGKVPFEIQTMSITRDGFDLQFTAPVDRASVSPAAFKLVHYHYPYSRTYGVSPAERTAVAVKEVRVSEDGRRVSLVLPEIVTGRLYDLALVSVRAADGTPPLHTAAYYTVNRRRP